MLFQLCFMPIYMYNVTKTHVLYCANVHTNAGTEGRTKEKKITKKTGNKNVDLFFLFFPRATVIDFFTFLSGCFILSAAQRVSPNCIIPAPPTTAHFPAFFFFKYLTSYSTNNVYYYYLPHGFFLYLAKKEKKINMEEKFFLWVLNEKSERF